MRKNYYLLSLSLLIIYLPLIEFLNFNHKDINFFYLKVLNLSTIVSIIFIGLISLIIKKFSKLEFSKLFFFLSIVYYLLFNYLNIKNLILKTLNVNTFTLVGEISLVLIIILSFIITLLFYKKKFFTFLKIYFLGLIGFNIINTILIFDMSNIFNKNLNKQYYYSKKTYDYDSVLKNNYTNGKNIYYIVFDAAIPFENFNRTFSKNLDHTSLLSSFNKLGYHYFSNAVSTSVRTGLTITSILNLNYVLEDDQIPFQNKNYPSLMTNFHQTELGNFLTKLNYKFYWLGNSIANCKVYNETLCLEYKDNNLVEKKSNFLRVIKSLNYNYLLINYYQKTPIVDILNKLVGKFMEDSTSKNITFYENDTINKFINNIDPSKLKKNNTFYFAHVMMPHGYGINKNPNIYNKDCSRNSALEKELVETGAVEKISSELWGYESNYLCFIKRLKELTNYINKFDKNSLVVILSDHGITTDNQILNMFLMTNLPKDCLASTDGKNLDQVIMMRSVLSCGTKINFDKIEKKTFILDEKENLIKEKKR